MAVCGGFGWMGRGDGAFGVVRLYLPKKSLLARDRLGWKIKYVKSYLGI